MGRIRTIKPEFWSDEKVGALKRDERLLFIGLLNLADDEGILKATPAFIKGQLFAYDEDLTIADVKGWLECLSSAKMLVPFEYNSEKFFLIRTFKSHQKINRPTPSKIPINVIESILNADSPTAHGVFSEPSLPEGKGREGNKEEEKEIEGKGKEDIPSPELNLKLINEVLQFFSFNPITNPDKQRELGAFLRCLMINKRDQHFTDQFPAYVEYKKINDSYVHTFKNFLGTHSMLFEDGAWNAENWIEKLKVEKIKINGKIIQGNTSSRSAQSSSPNTGGYSKL